MDIVQNIKYAIVIRDCGSLSAAAEKLYIAQPNLSRSLRQLETYLGTPLFLRTRTGVVTTPEGEKFLKKAGKLIERLDLLVESYQKQAAGSFVISTQLSSLYVNSIIQVQARHEDLDIDFEDGHLNICIDKVAAGRARVALAVIPDYTEKAFIDYFASGKMTFVKMFTSSSYLLTNKNNPYFNMTDDPDLSLISECYLNTFSDMPALGIEDNPPYPFAVVKTNSRSTRSSNMDYMTTEAKSVMIICQTHHAALERNNLISIPLKDYPYGFIYGYVKHKDSVLNKEFKTVLNEIFELAKAEL